MATYIRQHGRVTRVIASAAVASGLLAATACSAVSSPPASLSTSNSPEDSPTPQATSTLTPTGSEAHDTISVGTSCLATSNWAEHGITPGDVAQTRVDQRPADQVLFVTIPAQAEALSGGATVLVDGSIFCYLDPVSLEPLRHFDLVARGFQINLTGDQYQSFLSAPDPFTFVAPD